MTSLSEYLRVSQPFSLIICQSPSVCPSVSLYLSPSPCFFSMSIHSLLSLHWHFSIFRSQINCLSVSQFVCLSLRLSVSTSALLFFPPHRLASNKILIYGDQFSPRPSIRPGSLITHRSYLSRMRRRRSVMRPPPLYRWISPAVPKNSLRDNRSVTPLLSLGKSYLCLNASLSMWQFTIIRLNNTYSEKPCYCSLAFFRYAVLPNSLWTRRCFTLPPLSFNIDGTQRYYCRRYRHTSWEINFDFDQLDDCNNETKSRILRENLLYCYLCVFIILFSLRLSFSHRHFVSPFRLLHCYILNYNTIIICT